MKKRYDLEIPDLTPDLEWMLSSKQVSNDLLLERLLEDYHSKIFQLVYSIMDDRAAAEQLHRGIFTKALLAAHRYSSSSGAETWLYQIAWKELQKAYQKRKAQMAIQHVFLPNRLKNLSENGAPDSGKDDRLWQAVEGFGDAARWTLILHTLHGWPIVMISQVTGRTPADVQAALNYALQQVSEHWSVTGRAEVGLLEALSDVFSMRWPAPAAGEYNLDELAAHISGNISGRKNLVKPGATAVGLSILGLVVLMVLIGGGYHNLAGQGAQQANMLLDDSLQSTLSRAGERPASVTPTPRYYDQSLMGTLLMPRGSERVPMLTYTPTPEGVLYHSQEGEYLARIAVGLNVPLEDLRRSNRLSENDNFANGQLLYIPGSLPEVTPKIATPVPPMSYTLPLDTPASSVDIARLMFPIRSTYDTVWFDAILFMHPQLPFSDQEDLLRIQVWLSEDQALLLGGPLTEDPAEVLLQTDYNSYIAKPGDGDPWFKLLYPVGDESVLDPRLLYGAVLFFKETFSYGYPKYQYSGEEMIAGRPTWKISELDEYMTTGAEFNIDKETGFILKYILNRDDPNPRRGRAMMPEKAIITSIQYNVDFPQELFNPGLPWRGGYAWDYQAEMPHVTVTP